MKAYCLARECTQIAATLFFTAFCLLEIGSRVLALKCRRQNIAEGRH